MKVHFIGIGGIGLSGLARYFRSKGWVVSGSDMVRSGVTDALKKENVRVAIGHREDNVARDTGLVVYNRAIAPRNPEILAAKRRGVLTLPYAKVLGGITDEYATIAVTGSHGKSTTTALAALALIKGGFDHTVRLGTNLREFGGKNIRIGKGKYLVLEADDFGGAFLDYSHAYAIVTNIDREHLDYYKNFANLKNAFLKFMARMRPGGALILNRDDRHLRALRARISQLAARGGFRAVWYSLRDPGAKRIKAVLAIQGEHNLSNASAVYTLGKVLAIPEAKLLRALGSYRGAWRRMEYRGTFRGAPVFDDYAHHPTEIRATLKAFREKYPNKKLVCVFQPHQAKRLKALFKEFAMAFNSADETILLPIYKVAGRDERTDGFDSLSLAKTVRKRSPERSFLYCAAPSDLKKILSALPGPLSSKVIVMMGAGDVVNLTDSLVS